MQKQINQNFYKNIPYLFDKISSSNIVLLFIKKAKKSPNIYICIIKRLCY